MSQLDDPSPTTSDTSEGAPRPEDPGLAGESPSSFGLTWVLVLAAGLLGGLGGFAIGESGSTFIVPSTEMPPEINGNRQAMTKEMDRRRSIAGDQIAALAYGGLGMVLGVALGVAGGLARRAPVAAIAAGVTGLVLGGAAAQGRPPCWCPCTTPPAPVYGRESQRRPGIGLADPRRHLARGRRRRRTGPGHRARQLGSDRPSPDRGHHRSGCRVRDLRIWWCRPVSARGDIPAHVT